MSVDWVGPAWLKRPADVLGLRYFYRATRLSLRGPAYTDKAIEHLSELRDLKLLELTETRISDRGLKRLRAALPHCRIDRAAP